MQYVVGSHIDLDNDLGKTSPGSHIINSLLHFYQKSQLVNYAEEMTMKDFYSANNRFFLWLINSFDNEQRSLIHFGEIQQGIELFLKTIKK
ncbi:MAG TPA: hypothetical protein VN721_03260 [Flavipsychrobacter sp.]|nr:hypothetical protein [Flavipsychrobacter sp.]